MTEIQVGGSYVAKKIYVGRGERGPYEIIIVQNIGRNQPKIAISPLKVPSGIGPNGVFKIEQIKSVQHRKWRNPKSGVWTAGNVTVKARIKSVGQLSEKEMEAIAYNDVEHELPSLEDWFDG